MTLTCPQVEGARNIAFNGFDVGGGQILNMNVIANARSIWRWVVRSKISTLSRWPIATLYTLGIR